MAIPTTRRQFKDHILRRLGHPALVIDVTDEQAEDRIDEAIYVYRHWHFDATERILYKHVVTTEDKTNGYIPLPERIYGVSQVMGMDAQDWGSFFSFRYQFMLNEVAFMTDFNLVPYFVALQHISELQNFFENKAYIEFNKHTDKLVINTNWDQIAVNDIIMLDAHAFIDPSDMTDMWSDVWLQRYATALLKRQWGEHLSKFNGTAMLGGTTVNGVEMLSDANSQIEKLEEELQKRYVMPPLDFMAM